jgi:hypothetical protein
MKFKINFMTFFLWILSFWGLIIYIASHIFNLLFWSNFGYLKLYLVPFVAYCDWVFIIDLNDPQYEWMQKVIN